MLAVVQFLALGAVAHGRVGLAARPAMMVRHAPLVASTRGSSAMSILPLTLESGTAAQLFPLINNGALPAWFCLIFLPRWRFTPKIVTTTALAFAMVYVALVLLTLDPSSMSINSVVSLEGITQLMANPPATLTGWVHYICFDLWTALYIVKDAGKMRIDRAGVAWRVPHVLTAPAIIMTLLFGPSGLIIHFLTRVRVLLRTCPSHAIPTHHCAMCATGGLCRLSSEDGFLEALRRARERRATAAHASACCAGVGSATKGNARRAPHSPLRERGGE